MARETAPGTPKLEVLEGSAGPGGSPASRTTAKTPARSRSPGPPREHIAAVKEKLGVAREQAARPLPAEEIDLHAPEFCLNRELTWLGFNSRVLNEAQDSRNPLLERVKFLAIASSNLDEFFMKRIGGLKQLVAASVHQLSVDGRTPQQQISECVQAVKEMQLNMRQVYLDLVKSLERKGADIAGYEQLTEAERDQVREFYLANVLPLVTPLAMDPAHPFPFISNLSLNLLVTLRYRDEEEPLMNRIKVPLGSGVPRFLRINGGKRFVPLEQVMAHNLDLLFPEMEIECCEVFRVTRNANTELDEEQAEDLLSMIETELRYRKFAPFVRLEINRNMDTYRRGMLSAELGLDESADVFESDVLLGMRDLMELASMEMPELHDPDHHPITNTKLQESRSIFHMIREAGSILLHFPYESFTTSVERFVREASRDPKVRAIKMTLYRTSADTEILEYLIEAARNGKQVAVAVELKARFDEAANIRWASRLEDAGIHVTYGVVGLKTHAKAILVVRQDYSGLRRYAHIGTGNYHAGTARIYSDLGLLTCDDDIGHDLTELFNYLTSGCKPSRRYRKLLTAPKFLKKALLAKIDREIGLHSRNSPGLIRFKTNALEDVDITAALYRASRAGVKVELIVRDTCRLRPGVPDLSENVSVVSVLGRFLEHARICYFRNGGDEEYYIGSADLMRRNLERRVELIVPIEDAGSREDLSKIFEYQLQDQRSAWDMNSDGSYSRRQPAGRGPESRGCQQILIEAAEKRQSKATRLRRLKPRAIARRSIR
ncbi:MAG: polyphosphate kinase 1 [Rhodospirillales bacterium]|nr:polyphosphate kinase 1 [Rhodospirillales bacterium]